MRNICRSTWGVISCQTLLFSRKDITQDVLILPHIFVFSLNISFLRGAVGLEGFISPLAFGVAVGGEGGLGQVGLLCDFRCLQVASCA